MKDDKIYLKSILDDIEKIERHLSSKSEFDTIRDAVVFSMATIGEAANKISKELKTQYKNIEWRRIISMRNNLIHNYLGINYGLVEDSVKNDLPELKKNIEKILEEK